MKTDNIKIEPRWGKTKEAIWDEKFAGLGENRPSRKLTIPTRRRILMYAAAAAVVVFLILPSIAFVYTENIDVPRGEHLSVTLPDGSKVQVNADSRLSYKPIWWKISRSIRLEGEAYFEVVRGSDFKVRSDQATVRVLGTSFNIFSRAERYSVTCLTGRVEVSGKAQSVILTPGFNAVFDNDKLIPQAATDAFESIGWTENRFVFSGVPLESVIEEIERQYNIEVIVNGMKPDYIYSGNFTRTDDPAEAVGIVVKPFGLHFSIR